MLVVERLPQNYRGPAGKSIKVCNLAAAFPGSNVCAMKAVVHVLRATRGRGHLPLGLGARCRCSRSTGAKILTKRNDAPERLPQMRGRAWGALPKLARARSRLLPCCSWSGHFVGGLILICIAPAITDLHTNATMTT